MHTTKRIACILPFATLLAAPTFAANQLTVTALNKLPLARSSQTIEMTGEQLAPLGAKDLNTVHVKDSAGKELLAQAVDTDGDAYHKAEDRKSVV